MSKEYSQHKITRFFQQFKKLENSITKEKVHQIINDPTAKARYKVKNFKPLNLIIMTFLISISVVLALLYSTPEAKQINNTEPDKLSFKKEVMVVDDRTELTHSADEIEEKAVVVLMEEKTVQSEKK